MENNDTIAPEVLAEYEAEIKRLKEEIGTCATRCNAERLYFLAGAAYEAERIWRVMAGVAREEGEDGLTLDHAPLSSTALIGGQEVVVSAITSEPCRHCQGTGGVIPSAGALPVICEHCDGWGLEPQG